MVEIRRKTRSETLTLVSQLKESVVEETGIQSLDTIVAIRAVGDGFSS
jgi:hypothetical protein